MLKVYHSQGARSLRVLWLCEEMGVPYETAEASFFKPSEEFKGTGNSELQLDRKVADRRIFPAIDVLKSGTRKDELITPKEHLQKMYVLRRILSPMGTQDAIEFLLDKLKSSKNNDDFFQSMNT